MTEKKGNAGSTASFDLYGRVLQLLQRNDPARILLVPGREREYEPIAAAVVQLLPTVKSPTQLRQIIYDEAEVWICIGIGPEDRYEDAARDVWTAWQDWQHGQKTSGS